MIGTLGIFALLGYCFSDFTRATQEEGSIPIDPEFENLCYQEIRKNTEWTRFADSVALMYIGRKNQDVRSSESRNITISYPRNNEAIVEVNDHGCFDDSACEVSQRIILQQVGSGWVPLKHTAKYRGRGIIGWSTSSPQ